MRSLRHAAARIGDALLDGAHRPCDSAAYHHRHKWRQGDIVVWDNPLPHRSKSEAPTTRPARAWLMHRSDGRPEGPLEAAAHACAPPPPCFGGRLAPPSPRRRLHHADAPSRPSSPLITDAAPMQVSAARHGDQCFPSRALEYATHCTLRVRLARFELTVGRCMAAPQRAPASSRLLFRVGAPSPSPPAPPPLPWACLPAAGGGRKILLVRACPLPTRSPAARARYVFLHRHQRRQSAIAGALASASELNLSVVAPNTLDVTTVAALRAALDGCRAASFSSPPISFRCARPIIGTTASLAV